MIVKILRRVPGFPGVSYNTNKVDRNKGELLKVSNFGPLQALTCLRPQDYINYLQMISRLNTRVTKPQIHAVLSARGKSYDKDTLCLVAEKWLTAMGYVDQPYLIVFHKDTENNHVHLVSTRVDREGKKIDSAFEKIRAIKALDSVLGYSFAMEYDFSTKAQFYLILESRGFMGRDFDERKIAQKAGTYVRDASRAAAIRQLLLAHKHQPDFVAGLRDAFGLEVLFHASENKAPYGYTIIDHATKTVFKGSEVLPLKELLKDGPVVEAKTSVVGDQPEAAPQRIYVGPVRIADDIDDEAIHGRNRRRKKKTRTNSR